jgi:hypothetical protein
LLLIATAGVALGAHWWWWFGLAGIVLSQILITGSWSDAKFGTLANVVIAVPLLLLAVDARPSSFRSRFARDRDVLWLGRPVRHAPWWKPTSWRCRRSCRRTFVASAPSAGPTCATCACDSTP